MSFTEAMRQAATVALEIGRKTTERGLLAPLGILYNPSGHAISRLGVWFSGEIEAFPPEALNDAEGKTAMALVLLEKLFAASEGSASAYMCDCRFAVLNKPEWGGMMPTSLSKVPEKYLREVLVAATNQVGEEGHVVMQTYTRVRSADGRGTEFGVAHKGDRIEWGEISWRGAPDIANAEATGVLGRFAHDLRQRSLAVAVRELMEYRRIVSGSYVEIVDGKPRPVHKQ